MKPFAKRFGWMSVAVMALLLYPSISGADSLGAMRISALRGDVQVKIADTGEWVPASINMPLVEGDELWVPEEGRAAFQTTNGNHIRLAESTALQVLRMDSDSFQFYLSEGRAYVLSRAPKRSVLQIDTPDASTRAFGNARFGIDIPGGETDVSVFRGSVQVENDGGTTTVRAGNMLAVAQDGYAELSPVPPPDDWRRWNAQQDRIVLARGNSYEYLPEELRTYSSDFDDSGRWLNVPEYGYCWTPTIVAGGDWAPYRNGRWVWRGGDYVWVGFEPWGWAPYHYGRWAFTARIGWIWVPPARGDVYWAPGYVGWVRTGDHVAWVPLAPRETYYGYRNHGRYSRNITNVNITQVQVTNVYRNVNVTNSITVVNQNTFLTGRPAPVDRRVVGNVREDFSRRRNIVVGRPPIKPVETSYMPVVRQIPEAKRPPAAVRKVDTKELKRARPMVKEQGRSAFKPQGKPAPLEVRKVERPRPATERARERSQVPPGERRGPAASQGTPPAKRERMFRPREVEPKTDGKPERPLPPPEKVRPEPPQRGGSPGAAEQRVKPKEAEPKARPKQERPQQQPERFRTEPQRPVVAPGTVEPRVPPKEAEPKVKARPERPQPPPGKIRPEPQRPVVAPGTVEPRVPPKEAKPKVKARPERPQPPPERVRTEPQRPVVPQGKVEPRVPPKEAKPKVKPKEAEPKVKPKPVPARPEGKPPEKAHPEDRGQEEERGNRR